MSNTTKTPADAGPDSSEQLGQEPERAKWYARGHEWALTSALSDPGPEWMSDDIANAYADGAMAAVAVERGKLIAAVGALHMAQTINHQNYPAAWHDGVDAAIEALREA